MIGCTGVILDYCIIALSFFVTVASSHEISGCYGDTVTISCGADEKINILGDFYGLSPPESESKICTYSENDICVVPSHSHASVAKQVCNGRTNCIFTISEKHTCINGNKETTYQQIKYECIPETKIKSMCSDHTWISTSGFLTSANYPIFYPPRASCTCTLNTHDDSFILLKTAEFRLKDSSPCRDYLRVEPESNPEEVLCGSVHRIFEARSFNLHFQTQLTSFKGFLLSYEATSGVTVSCYHGDRQRSPTSTTTPRPARITTPPVFIHRKHGSHERYGSFREAKPQQDRAAHSSEFESFTDFDNDDDETKEENEQMIISNTDTGRNHSPKKEGKGPVSEIVPTDRPPVTPPLHMVSGCFGDIVHFQCKDGELIRIVEDLYGSAPNGRCSYEENDCVVEAVGQKSIVSQICSSKTRCMNFIVTRMFCGDRVTSYQQITYECVPATAMLNICSQTVMKTSEGYLSSPNFPGMYPRNQSCSCTLRADGDIVQLSMAHFALHDLNSCEDWLEIDLGDDAPAQKLCGSQHGDFRARSVTLTFISDAKYSHSGFWLHFQGAKEGLVTMACNVPIESVWPTTSTLSVSSTTTTTTTRTTPTTSTRGTHYTTRSDPWRQESGNIPPPESVSHNTPAPPADSDKKRDFAFGNTPPGVSADRNKPNDNIGSFVHTKNHANGDELSGNESENKSKQTSTGEDTSLTLGGGRFDKKGNVALINEASYSTTTTRKHLTKDKSVSSGSFSESQCAIGKALMLVSMLVASVYMV